MLTLENIHDPAGDIQEHQMFCLIADKIEADPGLLARPLATVERWLSAGHFAAKRLEEWRALLPAAQATQQGLSGLTAILRDDRESARFMKGFAPFPGLLTDSERNQFPCISRH